jgi:hypothetical protein
MFLGSKVRPVRRADNLTAICKQIVYTMWEHQHLTTLQVPTVCYGDSFTLLLFYVASKRKILNFIFRKHSLCLSYTTNTDDTVSIC